jgi:redox-sensitive bicupin YhaK (pirin superfamily)
MRGEPCLAQTPPNDPAPGDHFACEAIEQVITPRLAEIGGAISVRRALPVKGRMMIGPFIFFDQFGPSEFLLGEGMDVNPHPHIGLSTVTWLFEGEIMHRDSLGVSQPIRPGELNLMTAGNGVVHSERSPRAERSGGKRLFGIQLWAALPRELEEQNAAFAHYGVEALPRITGEGKRVRLIMGSLYGENSPAAFPHECFYAEAMLAPGAVLPLDDDYDERGVYVVSGAIDISGDRFDAGRLIVFKPGDRISILALSNARLMLIGGGPMDGPRHIWWNFVSSRKERIDQAKADWAAGRFGSVPGEEALAASSPRAE